MPVAAVCFKCAFIAFPSETRTSDKLSSRLGDSDAFTLPCLMGLGGASGGNDVVDTIDVHAVSTSRTLLCFEVLSKLCTGFALLSPYYFQLEVRAR